MEIIPMTIYTILFLIAIVPILVGKKPITYYIAKGSLPKSITQSNVFLKINIIISYIWAFAFALAFILVQFQYSTDIITNLLISNTVAFVPQILFAIPASIFVPIYISKQPSSKIKFDSVQDAFDAMPFGLNKEIAKGVDEIIQFQLTGKEEINSYFIIKNQKCKLVEGIYNDPSITIKATSDLWLDITNGEIDGSEAFLHKKYEIISDDASIMVKFSKLFDKSASIKIIEDRPQDYEYKSFKSKKIKNIVVFDGGPRSKKLSKTTLMVDKFIEGAKSAGANVEEFKLVNLDIHHCDGCFMCWTKTPGECVHKDVMTSLRDKYRKADLVVFASPIFIFNVSGIMKRFMDRLLPVVKPYMLVDEEDGHISHPDRFPECGEQGFVVFSAAGFPDIDGNFDGLIGMYRAWDKHSEHTHLMGEFLLPAAEMITQPVYKSRRDKIEQACLQAGMQVVNESTIDYKHMSAVSNADVDSDTFQKQADNFWANLDGKVSYSKGVIKI